MPKCSHRSSLRRSQSTQEPLSALKARLWCSTAFDAVYGSLSGSHRVQRVPSTEKNGRRHSSIIHVSVIDAGTTKKSPIHIDKKDVRVDTFRASGPGGQHRNKTDSGVRITHFPTGIVVTATEERSQHQNRDIAWKRLSDKLMETTSSVLSDRMNAERQNGFSSDKSFTWVEWRDTVKSSDGRKTSYKKALNGNLSKLIK